MLRTAIIDNKFIQFNSWTDEQYVLKEVLIDWCYDFNFKNTDVVLNLWWHIGAFDLFASDKVRFIVTLEPLKENYEKILFHLKANNILNVFPINKAISNHTGTETFGIWINNWHNGLVDNMPESESVRTVDTLDFQNLLKQYPFTKLKVDIEWWEYKIFEDVELPDTVNEIRMETHTFNDKQVVQHAELVEKFKIWGFNVEVIDNDHLNRTFLVHCTR